MAVSILVLHGPNLNMLGRREPGIYGVTSLEEINASLHSLATELGVQVRCEQTNHEGVLVDLIQDAPAQGVDFVIINPAAYTHTSVAIRDALAAVRLPTIEVHLSNVHQREAFRQHSYVSSVALGVIAGLGPEGYRAALRYAAAHRPN